MMLLAMIVYLGCYTDEARPNGLKALSLDEATGRMEVVAEYPVSNALYQALSPDGKWLYSCSARRIRRALKSFTREVQSNAREIAANAVECAPEIGGEGMGVMQDDRRDVEPLREVSTATKTNARPFRPCRDPCESKVGDKVIVVVKSADIAMAAGEEHFNNLPFVAFERDILKELPRLVTRNGMPRLLDVARTICRDIKPDSRVNCVPQPKIGNLDAKLVEPRREVPRNKRPA